MTNVTISKEEHKRLLSLFDYNESLRKESNHYGGIVYELNNLLSMLVLSTLKVLEDMEPTNETLRLEGLIYTAETFREITKKKINSVPK